MDEKNFKTYDEMLTLLASRNIDLSTPTLKSTAKKRLQHEGYYNLINGYKKLFLIPKESPDDDEKYKDNTTVDEIFALYNFDRKLRNTFLEYILIIETNIKSLISYSFCEQHPEHNYLIYSNFDTSIRDAHKKITSLISEIQKQISGRTGDPSISHYLKTYGYIPLWVLNNILTLGIVSKFYSLMKQEERQNVSKIFHISDNEMISFLSYLSKLRNFCAHGNRLYCFKTKNGIPTLALHEEMSLEKNEQGQFIQGKTDLFAALIIFKFLLPKNLFKRLLKSINKEIEDLHTHMVVLSDDDVLNSMGFPSDWRTKLQ